MTNKLRKVATISFLSIAGAGAVFVVYCIASAVMMVWPESAAPQVSCVNAPRTKFSADELHRLDSASGQQHQTYRTCILRIPSEEGLGLTDDNVVVELPGVPAQQVVDRGGWKLAANRCPLGEQDIQMTFGKEPAGQWTALTWNGEPAVCNASAPGQLPDVALARGDTTYELFTDAYDQLSSYAE